MLFTVMILIAWIACGHGRGSSSDVYSTNSHSIEEIGNDVFFEIVHPPELQFTYRVRPARSFGTNFNSSFSEKNIALIPTIPSDCCGPPDNADDLFGAVALIERGGCTFDKKTANAEKAGAKAVIISDHILTAERDRNSPMWKDYNYVDMDAGADSSFDINIPAGFLLGKNGRMIRDTLRQLNLPHAIINIPVNLTFTPRHAYNRPTWVHI
ncbi:PRADC1-like protein [Diachasmimorpha longicaudata]|uniref:PRADC1-like protein n=1 Tax=Diachasmimorpha longicaudata TaxID=58733 RepID=UPI0030B8F6D7